MPIQLRQQLLYRANRRHREPFGFSGETGVAQNSCQRLLALRNGEGFSRQNHGRGAIGNSRGTGGRHRAVFLECRLERWDLGDIEAKRRLVLVDHHLTLAGFGRHGGDLGGEVAIIDGRQGAPHRFGGEVILGLAGEVVFFRRGIGKTAHELAVPGTLQPVVEHMVEHFLMAQAITGASLGQQVGGIGHGLEAAGHHCLGGACQQLIAGQHDGAHRGPAHLVHGRGGNAAGNPGAQCRLTRRRLADSRRQDAPHDDFIDLRCCEARVGERRFDGNRSELRGRDRCESALESAYRGAPGGQNDDGIRIHEAFPWLNGGRA